MATTPFSTHSPSSTRGPAPEASSPAVVNVRRPQAAARADVAPTIAASDAGLLDDTALPPVVMRLPDLAADPAPTRSRSWSILSIAHWVGIVLGAIVALRLIFGGGPPALPSADDAPAWKAPTATQTDTDAPAWNAPQAAESAAPAWDAPAWKAPSAQSPTEQTAPVQDSSEHQLPESRAPESTSPELPAWDEAIGQEASHPGPPQDGTLRTARREAPEDHRAADDPRTQDAEPLGITVPVRQ